MKMTGLPAGWKPNLPASEELIANLLSSLPMTPPTTYIDLMRMSNGGFADLSRPPWTADFWPIDRLVQLNQEAGMDRLAPGYLAFGSNLGEEVLAFRKAEGADSGIYMLPWHSPSKEYSRKVFASLEELLQSIVNPEQN